MSFYENKVLPHLINFACTSPPINRIRQQIVPKCKGKVLEVGMGSGTNLAFYQAENIDYLWGLEPSTGMRKKAQKNIQRSAIDVHWLDLPGEQIPLEDESVDTVLLTFTLCTIPDWKAALTQMHRVLKPKGRLLFSEHGQSPHPAVQKMQNQLNPYWKKIAGGCNLNRPISDLISESGFNIESIEKFHAAKIPKFASYIYLGEATKNTTHKFK
jgi:ubiquinone/menaquinone biosynthesis C-methylase UbiE